jgi:hypothetical protein
MDLDATSFIQKRIAKSSVTEEFSKRRDCPHRHPHQCKYWIEGECWRKESCVYQHKTLELPNENFNDHANDSVTENIDNADIDQNSFIESESEFQQMDNNDDQVETSRRNPDQKLTTDEILELYENVEMNDNETISTDEIIKMYVTDEETSESAKDLKKVKKTSKKKTSLKKTSLKKSSL